MHNLTVRGKLHDHKRYYEELKTLNSIEKAGENKFLSQTSILQQQIILHHQYIVKLHQKIKQHYTDNTQMKVLVTITTLHSI